MTPSRVPWRVTVGEWARSPRPPPPARPASRSRAPDGAVGPEPMLAGFRSRWRIPCRARRRARRGLDRDRRDLVGRNSRRAGSARRAPRPRPAPSPARDGRRATRARTAWRCSDGERGEAAAPPARSVSALESGGERLGQQLQRHLAPERVSRAPVDSPMPPRPSRAVTSNWATVLRSADPLPAREPTGPGTGDPSIAAIACSNGRRNTAGHPAEKREENWGQARNFRCVPVPGFPAVVVGQVGGRRRSSGWRPFCARKIRPAAVPGVRLVRHQLVNAPWLPAASAQASMGPRAAAAAKTWIGRAESQPSMTTVCARVRAEARVGRRWNQPMSSSRRGSVLGRDQDCGEVGVDRRLHQLIDEGDRIPVRDRGAGLDRVRPR